MKNHYALSVFLISAALFFICTSCISRIGYNMSVKRQDYSPPKKIKPSDNFSSMDAFLYGGQEWFENAESEKRELVSFDGIKLNASIVEQQDTADKWVILVHPYKADAMAMTGFASVYYEKLGYNILLPDARGHGLSEGDYIDFGWFGRLDVLAWADLLIDEFGVEIQIVMHGMSMGGATVLMASGEDLPDNVKLVISDCSYTSAYDEVAYQLKSMFGLPDKPIVPDTSKYVYEKHGFSFEEVSALKKLEKTTVPVLFIHGKADTYVPTSMVYELFTACPAEKTLYTVAGARHCESVVINTEIYWDVVKEFINHYAED